MTIEQEEQPLDPIPTALKSNKVVNGKTWLTGVGDRHADIMFISPCVQEEEAAEETRIGFNKFIKRTPKMLECPAGVVFKDLGLRYGIDVTKCFYTSIIRYLPEKLSQRSTPPKSMLKECFPCTVSDIESVKPKIIVALGKHAFDMLVDFKAKESEIGGVWFYSKQFDALVYYMPHITRLIMKPEMQERFAVDFAALHKKWKELSGVVVPKLPINYEVIQTASELLKLVDKLENGNHTVLSVDCEWEGHQHIDGKLRSLQIAWDGSNAAYIRFRDDKVNYVFDVPYDVAGAILGKWLNRSEVKYIGHHISADLVWMNHWLGLNWFGKAIFDGEFAYQCCDETNDLSLKDLALRYTDLGRYDWDLHWWRKTHSDIAGEGFGTVPDEIIIPYAIKDVLCVYRCWAIIREDLERQKLAYYYDHILNPFVTDVFTAFCLYGLPMDVKKMDDMRELYNWAKNELEKDFQVLMTEEASKLLKDKLTADYGDAGAACFDVVEELTTAGKITTARNAIKSLIGPTKLLEYDPFIEHYFVAPAFNIRSKIHMVRWLFGVKGYTPVATTANKDAGMPAISWEKVEEYPPDKRKTFMPATNTLTLKILAAKHNDDTIKTLLELNAVGNICKAFLKEADISEEELYDSETGETVTKQKVKENGLHYWVASDGKVHGNQSLTETGRPRSH